MVKVFSLLFFLLTFSFSFLHATSSDEERDDLDSPVEFLSLQAVIPSNGTVMTDDIRGKIIQIFEQEQYKFYKKILTYKSYIEDLKNEYDRLKKASLQKTIKIEDLERELAVKRQQN
jgi:hypothetical protein